jgi:hypothetical protein
MSGICRLGFIGLWKTGENNSTKVVTSSPELFKARAGPGSNRLRH